MALDDEHRESSAEQPEACLSDELVVVSVEATSEQGAGSDEENSSDSSGDSENTSDSGGCLKIGAEVALAGVSYDFGRLTVMMTLVMALESFARSFPKGFTRPPGAKSVLDPRENEVVAFKDFFVAGLRIPSHLILLDIMCKFQVQLHQLMSNAIIQISKFAWAVTSCGGRPTTDIFTHHYELHNQNKKIHLEGSKTTFAAQFGCITFHLSQFGNRVRLTPAMRNKWTSG
jgi:hypothetical protein